MSRSCAGCYHWHPARKGPRGLCRRYAPTSASPVWPETADDDWCGDYEPAAEPDPEEQPN